MARKRCRPATPQESKVLEELSAQLKRELPCGHTLGDLVAAPGCVTSCGACRREGRGPALDPAEAELLSNVRAACAAESNAHRDSDYLERGELMFTLRPVTQAEYDATRDEWPDGEPCLWKIELPTRGMGFFGATPRKAFRRALEGIAQDWTERAELYSCGRRLPTDTRCGQPIPCPAHGTEFAELTPDEGATKGGGA